MLRRFIDGVGIQILQLQTIRGDELGNGEIADDYNADAREHQRRIEHTCGERRTVASWEKLLLYQYGSSDVNPAMLTPDTTKNGSREAIVLAFISSACTKVI